MCVLPMRLKQLRQSEKLLQKDIADKLNITASAYGFYEQGKRTPDSNTLDKLAEIFNVSTDYLLGRSDFRSIVQDKHRNYSRSEGVPLASKGKKDIAKDLDKVKAELMKSDTLMFDGQPMSDEAIESILSALEIGMQMARRKSKPK